MLRRTEFHSVPCKWLISAAVHFRCFDRHSDRTHEASFTILHLPIVPRIRPYLCGSQAIVDWLIVILDQPVTQDMNLLYLFPAYITAK